MKDRDNKWKANNNNMTDLDQTSIITLMVKIHQLKEREWVFLTERNLSHPNETHFTSHDIDKLKVWEEGKWGDVGQEVESFNYIR